MSDLTYSTEVTFDRPPVSEVIFSVQTEPGAEPIIDEVRALSDFWPPIRDDFPTAERQPPLPPMVETFDLTPVQPMIQLTQGVVPVRYWLVAQDGSRVVQVQGDRLSYNWRQVQGTEKYPRFETLSTEFRALLQKFSEVATLPEPGHYWCELTYVNTIPIEDEGARTHGQLAHILRYLERDPVRTTLPEVEDTQLHQRFRLLDDKSGKPVGRLHLGAVPGIRQQDMHPIYQVTLTVRGLVAVPTFMEAVDEFFERAHSLIVTGFVDITTERMHKAWGLHGTE